jgi:hypothetical protein
MRLTVRTLLCLSPLARAAGALYLLARADPTPLDPEGLTAPWQLTALDPDTDEGIRRAGRRSEAKLQVIYALIDGRLTPQQAVAQFRYIDADLPDRARRGRPPGYTEEEWPCREVISYVHAEFAFIRGAPAQAEAWVTRLEAELREQLRHAGAPRPHPDPETAGGPER